MGDVRLRVDRVAVQKAPLFALEGAGGRLREFEGKDVEFIVWFSVGNGSETNPVEYGRWTHMNFGGDPLVKLTDDRGNVYAYHTPPLAGSIKGGLDGGFATIKPGDPPVTDAISFDAPAGATTELRLSVLAPVVPRSYDTRYEFRIPASAWKGPGAAHPLTVAAPSPPTRP